MELKRRAQGALSIVLVGNWCAKHHRAGGNGQAELSESERAELERLRKELIELRMQRDVLERSVALWVDEAMGR